MERGEPPDLLRPTRGELQSDDPLVIAVRPAPDQPCGLGPVDQADCAVVSEQEVRGDVADRRPTRVGMTPHCEQELVLRGGEPDGLGLRLAPMEEAPKSVAELEQAPVVDIRDLLGAPSMCDRD